MIVEYVKAFFRRLYEIALKYPLAVAGTVVLVAAAVFCAVGGKTLQIGGLLGSLWGKKPGPDVRNLPPPNRKDENGNLIPPGTPDDKGWVQAPVNLDIKSPGIFSDPNKVVIVHPDKGEVEITLPTGVKNSDVKSVVEVSPDIYQVRNNDKGVDVDHLLEILK